MYCPKLPEIRSWALISKYTRWRLQHGTHCKSTVSITRPAFWVGLAVVVRMEKVGTDAKTAKSLML